MPELRHLQLLGNRLTNTGLNAILDGCPHLEHLDLRQCFNIYIIGDLKKQLLERIKDLRLPSDSTPGFPFQTNYMYGGYNSDDHFDYMYGGYEFEPDYDSESTSSSSSLPTSVSSLVNDEELRNWAELPPEVTSSILVRLGAIDLLENAQKVCRSWRQIIKDPLMWRKIDMDNLGDLGSMGYDLEIMCRHAVDRSLGGLVEIYIWYFRTVELLNYIADRSSNLTNLSLIMCYPIADEGFIEAVVKLPLLEYLEVSGESLKIAGQSCPNLKTLKLNSDPDPNFNDDECNDEDAVAIAESMPELRHLQLFGNILTNTGLNAILDGCPHLEHLDLRKCFNINLAGDIEKRCFVKIKDVRRPSDSTAGHPYGTSMDLMGMASVNYDYNDYWY